MGSSCPLLSSPTGNDPAFPKLALLARSHAGGLGASFGSAITESLLPEKAIHLSRNTVPPGSNCYRLRHGKGFPAWEPLNLQRTNSLRIRGCSFRKISLSTFQRTKICRLLSIAVRKILLCWLRELVAVRAVFKTLRGDRACKALSLGEVAAAVRLRIRPDLGELAKPDTKNGQDFRLAQSAQAISSSLFNLNTSQMSLIRS